MMTYYLLTVCLLFSAEQELHSGVLKLFLYKIEKDSMKLMTHTIQYNSKNINYSHANLGFWHLPQIYRILWLLKKNLQQKCMIMLQVALEESLEDHQPHRVNLRGTTGTKYYGNPSNSCRDNVKNWPSNLSVTTRIIYYSQYSRTQ